MGSNLLEAPRSHVQRYGCATPVRPTGWQDAGVLHVRLISPSETTPAVVELFEGDPTAANLVLMRGTAQDGRADLLMFDLARESANSLLECLRDLGLEKSGSIAFDEQDTLLSQAADDAEKAAPGRPSDGVIWDAIEAKAHEDARLSWSFVTFLLLAVLLAGTGRYLDQLILIVGAMVVGPEFAPVSAICFGLAGRRYRLVLPALRTLMTGFAAAILVALAAWAVAYQLGAIDREQAATGELTQFIIQPDAWSLIVAMLAGVAGVLSLTAAKSAALVGVFISVTTVPAAGAIALSTGVGVWSEAGRSLLQLGINLAGIILAGTLTMLVQRTVWHHVVLPRQRQRRGVR